MKKVRNTALETERNPLGFLGKVLVYGTSDAIERQESQGQRSFVESTTLPTDMSDDSKQILSECGVIFGDVVEGDELFQYVKLPEGWTKQGTDHSMHSDLLDEKGRRRAGIFYKAAFYDRSAHLSLNCRYVHSIDWDRLKDKRESVCLVEDAGQVIYSTTPLVVDSDIQDYILNDRSREQAVAWLDEHYPGWNNPAAYWDD